MIETLLKYGAHASAILATCIIVYYQFVLLRQKKTTKERLDILLHLNAHYTKIIQLHDGQWNSKNVVELLQNIADRYTATYSNITRSDCQMTVNVISQYDEEPVLQALVRDSSSQAHLRGHIRIKRTLLDDTASVRLLSGEKYVLEHIDSRTTANSRWPLPYRSNLVVPIGTKEKLLGFISLSSPKHGAFEARVDVDALVGLSGVVATLLGPIHQKQPNF